MSTETNVETRTYYEGPDPSELGSYEEPVKQAAAYVSSLNGSTRLRLAVDQIQEPWSHGKYTNAFFVDERGVFSHLRREGDNVYEGVLLGAGATREVRKEVFGRLGFDENRLHQDILKQWVANFPVARVVYLG